MSSLDLLLGAPGAEGSNAQQPPPENSESDFFFAPQGQSISLSNALDLILNDGVSEPAQQQQVPPPSSLNPNDEHLNNENFFDFFETSQQQQQQQQSSQIQSQQEQQLLQLVDIGETPEKCDLEMLKEALNLLKTASHKHNRILIEEGKL